MERVTIKIIRRLRIHEGRAFIILVVPIFCLQTLLFAASHDEEKASPPPESEQVTTESVNPEEEEEFDEEFEEEFAETLEEVFDPLSGYNRVMTEINDTIFVWVLAPTARGYRWIVPELPREAIARFFTNLNFPVRFVNNVFQLKFSNAGEEFLRFGINSTLGILGFADPAKYWYNLEAHPEDFGQTLGHYGAGSGFHIVLPLLGPSNLRDAVGLIPDNSMNLLGQIIEQEYVLRSQGLNVVNSTSLRLEEYESLRKDAFDLYPFLRDGYEQIRNKAIKE